MKLIMLFTYGVSLHSWHKAGLFYREIQNYKEMLKEGVEIEFITFGGQEDFQYYTLLDDIIITPFYASSRYLRSKYLRFLHSLLLPFILRKSIRNSDIIKTNQMWGSWIAVLAKLIYRKKLIVRCGFEKYSFCLKQKLPVAYTGLIKLISLISYNVADAIIITSQSERDFIIKTFSIDPKKTFVIPNYIDTRLFSITNQQRYKDRILFIGRLSQEKNIFSLLDAIKSTSYQLDIIGDGPLKVSIRKYIKKKSIRAKLLGTVPNKKIPEFLNKHHVFILPSFHEGNPKSLLEAMACGCSVIGTNVPGIRDVIQDGETGILCETNANSIRDAIVTLMENADLRKRLAANARMTIKKNNSLTECISKEIDIYKTVLSSEIIRS